MDVSGNVLEPQQENTQQQTEETQSFLTPKNKKLMIIVFIIGMLIGILTIYFVLNLIGEQNITLDCIKALETCKNYYPSTMP